MSGTYLAFEGVDGAGKSTVCRRVADGLTDLGHDVLVVREPGGTAVGEAVRDILLERFDDLNPWAEALLFAAARSQLAGEIVGPALAAGATVVSDRSVYSSLAYQGGARGLGFGPVREVNEAGLGSVWPEMVVLLRIDAERGLGREAHADRISREGIELQHKVAEAYDELAAADPSRFIVIEADRSIDEVVGDTLAALTERLA